MANAKIIRLVFDPLSPIGRVVCVSPSVAYTFGGQEESEMFLFVAE